MSLGGTIQYKYKKNSPNHMLIKCLVEGCPWKIIAHVVEGNVIFQVHLYFKLIIITQLKMNGHPRWWLVQRDVLLLLKISLEQLHIIFIAKYARISPMIMELNWHITKHGTLKRRQMSTYMKFYVTHTFLPWLYHRLREINPRTNNGYTSNEGYFM